jgi:hypothetical protein
MFLMQHPILPNKRLRTMVGYQQDGNHAVISKDLEKNVTGCRNGKNG